MTNFETLMRSSNKSVRVFALTVYALSSQQSFYSQLIQDINDWEESYFELAVEEIKQQHFKDQVDVVIYMEGL